MVSPLVSALNRYESLKAEEDSRSVSRLLRFDASCHRRGSRGQEGSPQVTDGGSILAPPQLLVPDFNVKNFQFGSGLVLSLLGDPRSHRGSAFLDIS